jgi:hypothetical protein
MVVHCGAWGAGLAAAGQPLGAAVEVRLPRFSSRRAAGGRPVSSVGGPTVWGLGLVGGLEAREGPAKI